MYYTTRVRLSLRLKTMGQMGFCQRTSALCDTGDDQKYVGKNALPKTTIDRAVRAERTSRPGREESLLGHWSPNWLALCVLRVHWPARCGEAKRLNVRIGFISFRRYGHWMSSSVVSRFGDAAKCLKQPFHAWHAYPVLFMSTTWRPMCLERQKSSGHVPFSAVP